MTFCINIIDDPNQQRWQAMPKSCYGSFMSLICSYKLHDSPYQCCWFTQAISMITDRSLSVWCFMKGAVGLQSGCDHCSFRMQPRSATTGSCFNGSGALDNGVWNRASSALTPTLTCINAFLHRIDAFFCGAKGYVSSMISTMQVASRRSTAIADAVGCRQLELRPSKRETNFMAMNPQDGAL